MKKFIITAAAASVVASLVLAGCGSDNAADTPKEKPTELTVLAHDNFVLSDELKAKFESESGLKVTVVAGNDGGALATQLVLSKDSPMGDVVFGLDNTFASRALEEGVFTDYESPAASQLSKDLAMPGSKALTAVDFGDVCLNYDPAFFAQKHLAAPASLNDLLKPEYKDLVSVTNAATSSPGLSFLFATIGEFGEDGYLDYWNKLQANGLRVADSWDDAYYVDFTVNGGTKPVVLSYATSPAYTVSEDGAATTSAALLDTCFRQVEYAGVIKGAKNPEGAQQFVDFLLGEEFQSTIVNEMYMYPVNEKAEIPAEFPKFAPVPASPIKLDPEKIATNRDSWIADWSAKVIG